VLAAACVGLLPSATYIGGVVNNDALGALVFTAALWLIFKSVRRAEIRQKAAVEIGVVCGLAALTKSQGLFLPPILAAAALLIARRNGWKASSPTLANAAMAIVIAILISSVWFARNWLVFGSPMIQSLYNPGPGWSLPAVLLITDQLFKCFWTPYWLIAVFVNGMLYTRMLVALCFVVIVGVAVNLRANRNLRGAGLDRRLDAWALLAFPALLIYIFLVRHTLLVDKGALQQGRLLLPAAGLFGIAMVVGLGAFIKRPAFRVVGGISLALGLILANIAVVRAIAAFYRIY
jgi:4-amino-4-deoxy-L-arabinose transferase-like glycosyltransferase